jgi:glycosyltransferase involved in cell wall biosynthesis
MRIGINGMLLWGDFSGVEVAIDRLVAALARIDARNEYVLYVSRDFAGATPSRANWSVHRTSVCARNRLARIAWEQSQLPRLALRDSLDVLHAPGYLAPLRCRVPVVLTIYDLFALTQPALSRPANVLYYRLALPRSVHRAARIIVPSRFVGDGVRAHQRVPPDRITVIPLGVDPLFQPVTDPQQLHAVQRKYRLPDRFLLFVGNLEPKKNLPRLLQAFAQATKALPEALALVIAGKPAWGCGELPALVGKLRVQDRVHFLNYVPLPDLPALYTLAEVLVFPSLCEGFGLPALEAMACGTPVVASGTTALGETVGDAAETVDPESTDSIAQGIANVLNHPERREELVTRGRRRAADFTWDRTAERTIGVYTQAVKGAR